MKKIKNIVYITIPIIVGIIFLYGLNLFFDKQISALMSSRDISILKNETGQAIKDKGIAFNEYIKNDNILVQGSSELSADVDQVVSRFFPIQGLDKDIITYGRGHVQDLAHSSIIGSSDMKGSDKSVVLLLSLQWFFEPEGTSANQFQSTFSPAQFYKYLDNENISSNNKIKYTQRISELLSGSNQFKQEKLYSYLYSNETIRGKIMRTIFYPYFWCRKNIVALKDKGLLYKELSKLPEKTEKEKRVIDWDEEYKKAEEQGRQLATNNEFIVNDKYYDKYLKDNLDKTKNSQTQINALKSREYEDYEIYLDTCKDLGIKPYIILMPANGWWYDYTGITKEEREAFYSKVEEMAKNRGFNVLNLKDKEYTPYFMWDVMHLGWKGWLNVDEEIYKHFK